MKQPIFYQSPLGPARRGSFRMRLSSSLLTLSLTVLLTFGLSSPAAHAQAYSEQILHSFTGQNGDGDFPSSGLTDVNGLLYGTAFQGGPDNEGVIFSFDPTINSETILYSFIINSIGAVFSMSPNGSHEQIIHSFTDDTSVVDGEFPRGSLIDLNGTLYGIAQLGGANDDGAVFSINPTTHAETLVHSFTGKNGDGSGPFGSLIAVNGILYGTTQYGGTDGDGTVFSLDPTSHILTVLYSFKGGPADGNGPLASLFAVNGLLYGTTCRGGTTDDGTVFSINPSTKAVTILHSFNRSNGDGYNPQASLILVNGLLYGATAQGGPSDMGTVFAIDPSTHTENVIYSFGTNGSADGNLPQASLLDVNGILYGTTTDGGTNGAGTLFALTPISTATTPVAHNDACTIKYNTTRTNAAPGILGNDDDGGEGPLTAALVKSTTHGTLSLDSDGSFTYTPKTGYIGTDTFTYRVSNPVGQGTIGTVTLTVQPTAPIAHNDTGTIKYNTAQTIAAPGVLANDDNGGEGPLTAALVSTATHGSLTLNSNGSFTYKPNTGYAGTDTFTYRVANPVGQGTVGTVTLTVQATTPTAHNDACTIAHNKARTNAAPGVLGNDDNGGSSPMTATLVTNVKHGTLTLGSNGSFTYTPKTGYSGTDTFTYQASNAVGKSNIATVTLTVL